MINYRKKFQRPIMRRPLDWICALAVVAVIIAGMFVLGGCTGPAPPPCTYTIGGACYYDPYHQCITDPIVSQPTDWRLVYYGGTAIYTCGPPFG